MIPSFRQQILGFGFASVLLGAAAGVIGLVATDSLSGDIDATVKASLALSASQTADMMHDALRGDALRARLGQLENAPDELREAESGLGEHAQNFDEAIRTLQGLPLSPAAQQALATARPQIADYVAATRTLVQAAARGESQVEGRRHQAAFETLEKSMAALSEALEEQAKALQQRAEAGVARTRRAIGAAMLLGAAAMTGLALWLAARLTRPLRLAADAADRLADGDLTHAVAPQGNLETRRVIDALARMRRQLAALVREVQVHAGAVAGASAEIAQGNQDLSNRTEAQASALQQTAATMHQLGSTVRHNADNAQQANQLAQGASDTAGAGGELMGRVVETMRHVQEGARRIADIVGTIDGIAFQTNILALNAAVEAARAGEQGRGFAVVASEVRALAQRSAAAAREVKTLVGASVGGVEQGTALVEQAGRTMDEIVASIRRVSDIVAEISAASREQSTGVAQVGEAVGAMDHGTQQNAALVEQAAAATLSLSQRSQLLVQAVAAFRVDGPAEPAAASGTA